MFDRLWWCRGTGAQRGAFGAPALGGAELIALDACAEASRGKEPPKSARGVETPRKPEAPEPSIQHQAGGSPGHGGHFMRTRERVWSKKKG